MKLQLSLVLLSTCLISWPLISAPNVDRSVLDRIADDDSPVSTVVVGLKETFDSSSLNLKEIKNRKERTAKLVAALEAHTKKTISNTLPFLIVGPDTGVEEVTPLWINNSVRVRAKAEVIKKLTTWWGIDSINLESRKEISEMLDDGNASFVSSNVWGPKIGWGVEKVRAPELWKGTTEMTPVDGNGVLVAMIDSGVNYNHPDLKPNIFENPGETGRDASGKDKATNGVDDDANGFVDDVRGWNFEDKNNDPMDKHGHGSQTAGIVGGMGAGGTQTGVAPKAKLLVIRACCDLGGKAGETAIIEGMQYAMKMGAQVISMSLSIKHFSNPSYAMWRKASETMLEGGVIHINSAGNRGSGNEPNNIGAPASNPPPWYHPQQTQSTAMTSMITIGATDNNDVLRNYSSVGPVTWESIPEYKDFPYEKGAKPGLIKPDICGPSETPSTSMDGKTYTESFGGTSSATPHIGGVVALMVQAHPELTPAEALEALSNTAIQVESPFNNKCGAGRADAFKAVEYVRKNFVRNRR